MTPDPNYRRNFALGVANGAIVQVNMACIEPGLVVAAFIAHLLPVRDTNLWVGLAASLMMAGWLWPPAFVAHRLEQRPHKLHVYRRAAYLRLAALAALVVLSGYALALPPKVAVGGLVFVLFAHASFGGIAILPFFDIVGKSIPANRRGRFFGLRRFIGGLLAFFTGLAIKYLLDEHRGGFSFPTNYTVLFALAWLAAAIAYATFIQTREPTGQTSKHPVTLRQQFRRGPRLLRRDRNYRTLVGVRLLSALSALSLPFLFLFARARLGATDPMVGLFVSALMISSTVSNVLWAYVGDERGNRQLLLMTNSLALLMPVAALLAPRLPGTGGIALMGVRFTPQLLMMCAAFLLIGFARTGQQMGETNFLLEIAPERRRPTYMGLMQTCMLPMAFAPVLGALVIGPGGRYEFSFGLSLIAALLGIVLVYFLRDPRDKNGAAEEGSAAAG